VQRASCAYACLHNPSAHIPNTYTWESRKKINHDRDRDRDRDRDTLQAVIAVNLTWETRVFYYREAFSNTYSPVAYMLGLVFAEFPFLLMVAFLHSVVMYPVTGMYNDPAYIFEYFFVVYLFATMLSYWGHMLAAALPSKKAAGGLCMLSLGLMNIFAGFFVPERSIPWPWKVLFYISPSRFGLRAAMTRQFYCDVSCFSSMQTAPNTFACNSPALVNLTSLSEPPFNAKGPGCNLVYDTAGGIARVAGTEWVVANLGAKVPWRVTVWDYFTTTTGSKIEDEWTFVYIMIGMVFGFKLIMLRQLFLMRNKRS
jgi:hypothetical protein